MPLPGPVPWNSGYRKAAGQGDVYMYMDMLSKSLWVFFFFRSHIQRCKEGGSSRSWSPDIVFINVWHFCSLSSPSSGVELKHIKGLFLGAIWREKAYKTFFADGLRTAFEPGSLAKSSRTWSIFSRVRRVSSSTSAAVRPLVDIGGRTVGRRASACLMECMYVSGGKCRAEFVALSHLSP